jgi:hypothetical protein
MKTATFLSIIVFFSLSCATAQNKPIYNKQLEQSYVYDFKMTYFKKLLLSAFGNSDAIKTVISSDHSGYGEAILSPDDYKYIDRLVEIDNQKMIQDSIARIGRGSEGAQGKRIFDYALLKYQSKWLDSIAKYRSNPFVKNLRSNN